MRVKSKILLSPSHLINYPPPENYCEEDDHLFYDVNFHNTIPRVELHSIENASISNKYVFTGIYLRHKYSCHKKVTSMVYLKSLFKKIIKPKQHFNEAILGIQQWDHNYFHWMTEVLPGIVAAFQRTKAPVLINTNSLKYNHIIASLKLLDIPFLIHDIFKKTCTISSLHLVKVPVVAAYNELLFNKMKNLFFEKINITKNQTPKRKIYISRKKAPRRKVENEDELLPLLFEFGFEIVCLEDYTLQDQIQLLSESKIVIGLHGAGLTNCMFMNPSTILIELKAFNNDYWCFFSLARLFKLKYYYLLCQSDQNNHRDANINVDDKALRQLLLTQENML